MDFKEEKEIILLKMELENLKHNNKKIEMEGEAKLAKLQHDYQLEVIRIKSAEVRRSQERKFR
jgi:hypothetical protein